MDQPEIKKSEATDLVNFIEYVPHSEARADILRKINGGISIAAIDPVEEIIRKTSPFDIFIEIIEGSATIIIEGKPVLLKSGQATVIPAHAMNHFATGKRFKMLETVIKSGYEQDI